MRSFDVLAGVTPTWPGSTPAGRVVAEFLGQVRITGDPDAAAAVMAPVVRCHQMNSEAPATIERTPADYAEHVREMLADFDRVEYVVTELLSENDHVYVRWQQTGHVLRGQALVELGSAVYRVSRGCIAEYWIQLDRHGLLAQINEA